MKMIKRTLIILIIAATIFTVVKCNRTEEIDNIKQEQGDDTLPKDNEKDKEEKEEQDKDDKQDKEEKDQEEIEYPVELG